MVICLTNLEKTKSLVDEYNSDQANQSTIEITLSNSHRKTFVSGTPDDLKKVCI